jgi:hypothetical protein
VRNGRSIARITKNHERDERRKKQGHDRVQASTRKRKEADMLIAAPNSNTAHITSGSPV